MSRPQVVPSPVPARAAPGPRRSARPSPGLRADGVAPRRRRGTATGLGAALVAAAVLAPSASADVRAVSTIAEPLLAQPGPDPLADPGTLGATATGDGRVAWVTVEGVTVGQPVPAGRAPVARVRTLRGGVPVDVATFPVTASGLKDVEVGTSTGGHGVLAVSSWGPDRSRILRLVDLDTGAVRVISSVRRGLAVDGLAIDDGTLLYVVHPARVGPRNTSSLWRATLTGTSIGRAEKLRTSRRGETWFGVHADRGRVAVSTSRAVRDAPSSIIARDELAFGTPRGPWTRTGEAYATEGGYRPVFVLGFTRDRRSVVTVQAQEGGAPIVTRTPAGGGRTDRVRLGSTTRVLQAPSYDAASNRILAFGPDDAGTASVGWTGPVFR
jgi:hypothetical protein